MWNPSREAFSMSGLSVGWYGLLFACGFLLGYFVVRRQFFRLYHDKALSTVLTDRLIWVTVVATIVGARLGEVFFYSWSYYKAHPWAILKIWEGGLASHGAVVAILVALVLYTLYTRRTVKGFTFWIALDVVVLAASLIGAFIRFGNFINQEIVGRATTMPWGIIFGHDVVARHPVQLYEALVYLGLFVFLFFRQDKPGSGRAAGYFFLIAFSFRFLIEFWKAPQGEYDGGLLSMGQWLSIPFIIFGAYRLCKRSRSGHQAGASRSA